MKNFKNLCAGQGWKTSETDDWVEADEKYHNFLCTKKINPSGFKSITRAGKCVVREGLAYRVVESSYMAWVFSEPPSDALITTVLENPELPKKIAVYDLSPLLEGRKKCVKLNHTGSHVFSEFERFLRKQMGVKFEAFLVHGEASGNCEVANLA
jgi:hypothetical protein